MDKLPDGVTPACLGGKRNGTEDSGLAEENGGRATGLKGKAPAALGKAGAR